MPGSGAPVKNSARFIVIGNQFLLARVVERAHPDVMWFKTIADFERWRRHQAKEALPSLSSLVDLLVKSAIRPHRSLPQELKFAFAWLRKQDRVPVLKALAAVGTSRRSFFRKWHAAMAIPPSVFLHRLRKMHAHLLLKRGMTITDVVHHVGVASAAELEKILLKSR